MSNSKERLISLIEFAKQSALLRSNPVKILENHRIFLAYEHKLAKLPGIHFNIANEDEDAWLVVDRLQKLSPPQPKNKLLQIWINLANNPNSEPKLHLQIFVKTLTDADIACSNNEKEDQINLESFPQKEEIEKQFAKYIENEWQSWSKAEKIRRETIALYNDLFILKQQLEGEVADNQLELVWGIGLALWETNGDKVKYPLITQLVELCLDESSMAIKVRPRNIEPRMELEIYANADNPAVLTLEKIANEFFTKTGSLISPFDSESYAALLKSAATHLDGDGVYWPSHPDYKNNSLPTVDERLKITDSWAIFARPRGASLFIQDLDRFKNKLENNTEINLPEPLLSLVSEPAQECQEVTLTSYRGRSMTDARDYDDNNAPGKSKDLFFPLPFNDEQVRIAQLIEQHNGVVVQGPPGTGKTHTIANIICHYLAMGKKVLVTSMKEPALSVLQEKLPEAIKPLAIALLTNEAEGTKQFEYAISKIASEVQTINRTVLENDIKHLEADLNTYHGQLSKIDRDISSWAFKNLNKIHLDEEKLDPMEAAQEVINTINEIAWLDDEITNDPKFSPKFIHTDIIELKEARRKAGNCLKYLDCSLPKGNSFYSISEIIEAHKNLTASEKIKYQIETGEIPSLPDYSQETIELAKNLYSNLSQLKLLRLSLQDEKVDWPIVIIKKIRVNSEQDLFQLIEVLSNEVVETVSARIKFITKPVVISENADLNSEVIEAIKNLSVDKKSFGLTSIFSKKDEKQIIDCIRIITDRPTSKDDWQHVLEYITKIKEARNLISRWNALATELCFPVFEANTPLQSTATIVKIFSIYNKLKEQANLEKEIYDQIQVLFPSQTECTKQIEDSEITKLEKILSLHIRKFDLDKSLNIKESSYHALLEYNDDITLKIKDFFLNMLGNISVTEEDLRTSWSQLMAQLNHIHHLELAFCTIKMVTNQIEESGAIKWAERLRGNYVEINEDALIPNNWNELWRLKRLYNAIKSIDARLELKRLSKLRNEIEIKLSKTYQAIVAQRTWLQLVINATPSVRGALMGYVAAITKMGKGTGKRAFRYRLNARAEAKRASSAIPCWIMPHYRISESLPDELGYFDLIIIDEASQSDLTALPALFRAKKILIVGDDKQVSPEGVGMDETKIRNLITRYLSSQVEMYRAQMTPESSIYDLFKVVFASSAVMLKEHFRCVPAIIEYSKREFYNNELKPLRLPLSSERLDPPLIDVLVEDGFRSESDPNINLAEVKFIIDEIKAITQNPNMISKTIGIVSLIGNSQAQKIFETLQQELAVEIIHRHKIACGDARTFQGKERDIMFLSLIATPGNAAAMTRNTFAQRFNVAASRARDRMYLVRSVTLDDLSLKDHLRRNLISHFSAPFNQDEIRVKELRDLCESGFELEIYDILTELGYCVTTQVKVSEFRIDMVVEGCNDSRLAIECDGDRYHGPDRWEHDIQRQRILERAGWKFWRCFASTFVMYRKEVIEDLLSTLSEYGIQPIGAEGYRSPLTELRRYTAFSNKEDVSSELAIEELAAEKLQ
ncbi:MAG: AAA domain-containing protein [Gammaproteobacteria bacterium]|nr:AAA domain-containing protein [Gammaproteobacteria bacterium]